MALKYHIRNFFPVFFLTLLLPSLSLAFPSNRILGFDYSNAPFSDTVIVFLERQAKIDPFVLNEPKRIAVDISDSVVPQVHITQKIDSKTLKCIRVGQNKKDTARVVLDLDIDDQPTFDASPGTIDGKPVVIITVFKSIDSQQQLSTKSPGNEFPQDEETFLSTDPGTFQQKKHETILKSGNNFTETSLILFDEDQQTNVFSESEDATNEISNFSISGILHIRSTIQTSGDHRIENDKSLRKRALLEAKYKNQGIFSLLSDYLYFGGDTDTDDWDLDVYEAKWQQKTDTFGFSLGKQIIRWGKADQLSPVDTINPQDLRESNIPDYEERKIPVWMAQGTIFFESFSIEGVYIPFFERSKIDYFQTNWSVFGHLKEQVRASVLPSSLKSYFNNINVHENLPDDEHEFAARITGTFGKVDLGFSFHHTIEDTPYFKSFPIKNIQIGGDFSMDDLASSLGGGVFTNEDIEVEFKEANIIGFEFETTFSDFGFRGEAAFQDNESFLTDSLTSVRKPTITYILGADHTTRNNSYVNLQFSHRHISGYLPNIYYFDQDTFSILGEVRADIVSDWLKAGFKYNKTLNNDAWYFSPYIVYSYITNLECKIGAHLFSGNQDTWFGHFKDNDVFFLNLSLYF